jgi:hypothetical protein
VNRVDRVGLTIGLVVGLPIMAFGVVGLIQHTDASPPGSFLRFFVGGDAVHDLLIAPIAGLVGVLVLRHVSPRLRGPLRAALFTSAIVVAVAWPGIRAYGRVRAPDNSSVQPLNYATAVATVILVVWLLCALWLVVDLGRTRRRAGPRGL